MIHPVPVKCPSDCVEGTSCVKIKEKAQKQLCTPKRSNEFHTSY